MRPPSRAALCLTVPVLLCPCTAFGDVMYLTQQRSIRASTTADGNLATATAPDFARFLRSVFSSTPFPTSDGGTGTNTGGTTIDCQLDPNAIRASGSLTSAGGLNVSGNLEIGEAAADIRVTFHLDQPAPFLLRCTPRPSTNPADDFEIKLENLQSGDRLFELSNNDPAQSVDLSGLLPAGDYFLRFAAELTSTGAENAQTFDFQFLVPAPGVLPLLAGALTFIRRRR